MRQKSSRAYSFHVERFAWCDKYSMKAVCLTDLTPQWGHWGNNAGLCSLALKSKNRIEPSPRSLCPDYGSSNGHYVVGANKPSKIDVLVLPKKRWARPLNICSAHYLYKKVRKVEFSLSVLMYEFMPDLFSRLNVWNTTSQQVAGSSLPETSRWVFNCCSLTLSIFDLFSFSGSLSQPKLCLYKLQNFAARFTKSNYFQTHKIVARSSQLFKLPQSLMT